MNKIKAILSFVLSMLFVLGMPIMSFASAQKNEDFSEYEEIHDQINFDYLSILVIDKNVVVDIDPTVSILKRSQAKEQKEKYDEYIKENRKVAEVIYDTVKKGENLCVVSYTVAPVVAVNDHYERVKKEEAYTLPFGVKASAEMEISTPSKGANANFQLTTIVTREGNANPYTYTALTMGVWNTSTSIFTGENKPAAGKDFVLQACPTVTSSSEFSCDYNYATSGQTSGQEGVNYFRTNGFDSWVEFSVEDDPFGLAQMEAFGLTQTFKAVATTNTKKINSYYIHTWQTMNLDVTVTGVAGTSEGTPAAQVGLSINPTKTSMWWPLYNSVSYDW